MGVAVRMVGVDHDSYGELGSSLGRGGEGEVFSLVGDDTLVVKRYHDEILAARGESLRSKLTAMVAKIPESSELAWPQALVYERSGDMARFVGYTMDKVDLRSSMVWGQLAHVGQRRESAPSFSFRHGVRVATNLAAAMWAAHEQGAVLGDVNESNVLVVADATVRVIDCDSAQVSAGGKVFRCTVGKAEYTAPELVGKSFADVDRTSSTDVFAFAVLVFQLLLGGAHPFEGLATNLDEDPPDLSERIVRGSAPYFVNNTLQKPLPRVASSALPRALRPLFKESLVGPAGQRPSVKKWYETLTDVETNLVACSAVRGHAYDKRDGVCGWCAHASSGQSDVWGPASVNTPGQRALPPVSFSALGAVAPMRVAMSNAPSAVQPAQHSGTRPVGPGTAAGAGTGSVGQQISGGSWSELFLRHPVLTTRHFAMMLPFYEHLRLGRGRQRSSLRTKLAVAALSVLSCLIVACVCVLLTKYATGKAWTGTERSWTWWSVAVLARCSLAGVALSFLAYWGTLLRKGRLSRTGASDWWKSWAWFFYGAVLGFLIPAVVAGAVVLALVNFLFDAFNGRGNGASYYYVER